MVSGKHSIYTHFPKDPKLRHLLENQNSRAPCRKRTGAAIPWAENFGDLITADHKVLSENCESRNSHRYAVVAHDSATQWIQSYPCKTKISQETERVNTKVHLPLTIHKNLAEPVKIFLGIIVRKHPQLSKRMVLLRERYAAERAVRRIKEGTSAVLLQSGLNEKWLADSMECYTYAVNTFKISCLMGKTLHERRFGEQFKGPVIPFSAMVEYHPISSCQDSTSSARRFYVEYSSVMSCMR